MHSADESSNDMARLSRLAGRPQSGVPDHLSILREGVPYHIDSVEQAIGLTRYAERKSGLIAPVATESRTGLRRVQVFVTSQDYLSAPPEEVARHALGQHDPIELLLALVILNRLSEDEQSVRQLARDLANGLKGESRTRFEATMATEGRHLLPRQPLLVAVMLALAECDEATRSRPRSRDMNPLGAAILLVHALAASLGGHVKRMEEDSSTIGGWPSSAVLYLAQNALFNEGHDVAGALVATDRLWNDYFDQNKIYPPCPSAQEQLSLALGLPFSQFVAISRAVFALAFSWKLGDPVAMQRDLGLASPPTGLLESFWPHVALPLQSAAEAAKSMSSEWHFLALERFPALDLEDGRVLVLDSSYLLRRTSTELWRYVDDIKSGRDRVQWRQSYAEAFELMLEDQLRRLAPQDLSSSQPIFFTEEDFQKAYKGKACDAAICYGEDWLLFEIHSARFTVGARQMDDPTAFVADTRKFVEKKAGQLDQTAKRLLKGLSTSISGLPIRAQHVFPIIVVPESYPRMRPTVKLVEEITREHHWLKDGQIRPLVVLSRADVDILEAMLEEGVLPNELLADWLDSPHMADELWNYVFAKYGSRASRRPNRVMEEYSASFDLGLKTLQEWGVRD